MSDNALRRPNPADRAPDDLGVGRRPFRRAGAPRRQAAAGMDARAHIDVHLGGPGPPVRLCGDPRPHPATGSVC